MSSRTTCLAALGLALLAALATTPSAAAPSGALSPEALAPQVAAAEQVGAAIYRHDRAASVATDVLDEIAFRRDNRLAGWVTEEQGDSIVVTFIGGEGRNPSLALYRVAVSGDGKPGKPQELKPGEPLSQDQIAQFAARTIASKQKFELICTPQFNSVVLAAGSGDKHTWVVYMLPGTTDPKVLPVGGAYRIETDSKGSRVLSRRAFSKSCLSMPVKPEARSLVVTHLLDPHPTEIHVFLSLLVGKPIYVGTSENELLWAVNAGKIHFVSAMNDGKK